MDMDVNAGIKARISQALLGSLVVLAAVTLAGCGGGNSSGAGTNQGPQPS